VSSSLGHCLRGAEVFEDVAGIAYETLLELLLLGMQQDEGSVKLLAQ
jgi:hypothetical protein